MNQIGCFPFLPPETPQLQWNLVGVFRVVALAKKSLNIHKSTLSGKGILVCTSSPVS
jgi:hypothetical protein